MEIIERVFEIHVTKKGERVVGKFELDKTARVIKGIKLTSDREDLLYNCGTQKIEINGKECFEENYESKNLYTTANVDANKRYKSMNDKEPGNGIIVLTYLDTPHPLFAFAPYRVSLYVEYEV